MTGGLCWTCWSRSVATVISTRPPTRWSYPVTAGPAALCRSQPASLCSRWASPLSVLSLSRKHQNQISGYPDNQLHNRLRFAIVHVFACVIRSFSQRHGDAIVGTRPPPKHLCGWGTICDCHFPKIGPYIWCIQRRAMPPSPDKKYCRGENILFLAKKHQNVQI